MTNAAARLSAAAIAAMALIAMIPPFGYAMRDHDTLLAAVWALLRAFTITTNLLLGLVFLRIAWGGREAVSALLLGGAMLAIMFVGVIFNLLLDNMTFETVWAWLGDRVHHVVLPIAAPVWWLAFARKGAFGWRAPFVWMLYPLAYVGYLVARAQFEPAGAPNRYIYFFLDADSLGWGQVALNIGGLALVFVSAGCGVVWLDERLARIQEKTARLSG